MSWLLSILNTFFGTKEIFGFSVSQIIAWLNSDAGKKALAVAKGVIEEYKKNGATDFEAGINFLASVAKIHKMTQAEEKVWMERNTFAANANNDFPQQVSNG